MNFTSKYKTKIGWLEIKGNDSEIHSILFFDQEPAVTLHQPDIARQLID